MRHSLTLLAIIFALGLYSCKKEHEKQPPPPPSVPEKHILLKDITIPNLPSPFYHFEYNSDSLVTKVDFASGYSIYDVLFTSGRVSEMRNNILVNHDTLRYLYDQAGKLSMIKIINSQNVFYKRVNFTYAGDRIREIEWEHRVPDGSFLKDRSLEFTFFSNGNVQTIAENRPPLSGVPEYNSLMSFDQYDDKLNVDDFSLIHLGFHEHLFLLQTFRLQKNNPGRERLSVNGTDLYIVDYTYGYNNDNTPSVKTGDLLYLSGSEAGKSFITHSFYTYY